MADPREFMRDRSLIATRWRADPQALLGAFRDDTLVGSCVITRWGNFGFMGPVSVRPEFWDKGVAKQLVAAAVAFLDQSGIKQAALLTFAGSPKHIALYQKFGFRPQYLTPVMAKPVASALRMAAPARFSTLPPRRMDALPRAMRRDHQPTLSRTGLHERDPLARRAAPRRDTARS